LCHPNALLHCCEDTVAIVDVDFAYVVIKVVEGVVDIVIVE